MELDLYQMLFNNDEAAYKEIYKVHFSIVKQYVLKNNGSEEDVKDLFQEGIIALWDNIRNEKYRHVNNSMLHGYFRTICKYKWIEVLRSRGKFMVIPDSGDFEYQHDDMILNNIIKKEEVMEFMSIFYSLNEKCRQILTLFYYDRQTMKEISEITGYEITSMRNEKYKCIEKLKRLYLGKQLESA